MSISNIVVEACLSADNVVITTLVGYRPITKAVIAPGYSQSI